MVGCLTGALASFFMIPVVLKFMGIRKGYVGGSMVRFHPVVLLSLAASLSVYLCVVTMLDSQAARTIVSNFMDSDLTGWNGSIVERIRE